MDDITTGRRQQAIDANRQKLSQQLRRLLPPWLGKILQRLCAEQSKRLYVSGGTVRDLLVGKTPQDLDCTIDQGASEFAAQLARLCKGSFVPLGRIEDAARVVCDGLVLDFSSFREQSLTIEEDLWRRDFSINALALPLQPLLEDKTSPCPALLDPCGGLADLAGGLIRCPRADSFQQDPLRMLRAFRFAAELDFSLSADTLKLLHQHQALIQLPSGERIAYELDRIMASNRAHAAFAAMNELGLLASIFPELEQGRGVAQPKSHHLDVLSHNLEALRQIEHIAADPSRFFTPCPAGLSAYLAQPAQRLELKWAALFHDLGKPACYARDATREGRITFHRHDYKGVELFLELSTRLRWSKRQRDIVALLIGQHMRPFHLANEAREEKLSLKASIRLIKALGEPLPGLFALAMADALAGQGEERIVGMEAEISRLYHHLDQVREQRVAPVQQQAPLISGRDLIELLDLAPGPLFKKILQTIEEARMEERVHSKQEALELARQYLLPPQ